MRRKTAVTGIVAAAIIVATTCIVVTTSIVVTLLASAIVAQGFASPQKMPAIAGDYGNRPTGIDYGQAIPEARAGDLPFAGLASVDYLGKVRDLPGVEYLGSMFPGTWLAGRSSADAPGDRAEYLGFTYVRSGASPPEGSVFYTGEKHDGRQIYVSPAEAGRPGMPGHIYLRLGYGFDTYELSGVPPVYAYVACGAFNAGESVRFGVLNNGGTSLELRNAAPFEVQRKEGGGSWRTVYSPFAAQVITPVPNSTAKEWQWDQRLDDDTAAPFGDYRVLIDGKYAASFRVAADTPAVQRSTADYDRSAIASLATASSVPQAFEKAYPSPSAEARGDIVSIMLFKASALGLDYESLRSAIDATGDDRLPCLAIHAKYEGRPAWMIAFSPGTPDTSAPGIYAVDAASGRVLGQA